MKKIFFLIISFTFYFGVMGQEPRLVLPVGHNSIISSAKFNFKGNRIISSSWDNTAKLWDANTGVLLISLLGHSEWINSASFSFDEKKIITASNDRSAKVWDATTGNLLFEIVDSFWLSSANFSPDGKKIITACRDLEYSIRIWDAQTGKYLYSLKGHKGLIKFADFSSDGKIIVTAAEDSTLKVWDTQTGKLLKSIFDNKNSQSFSISSDCKKVLMASNDNAIEIVNIEDGSIDIRSFFKSLKKIRKAIYSPDSKYILVAYDDNTLETWNIEISKPLVSFQGHKEPISSISFSADGSKIISSSHNYIKVWDNRNGSLLLSIANKCPSSKTAEFSSDGKNIITSDDDLSIKIWNAFDGKLSMNLRGHTDKITSAHFNLDNNYIVTSSSDKTVKIWDPKSAKLLFNLQGHSNGVESSCFSPDGKQVASCSIDRTIKTWDVQKGVLLKTLEGHKSSINTLSYSPDGKKILSASWDKTVKVWDSEKGMLLYDFLKDDLCVNMLLARYSPDGKKVVTLDYGLIAKVWDTEKKTLLYELNGKPAFAIINAKFSPDNKSVLTICDDNTIKIWSLENGKIMFNLVGHKQYIQDANFDKEGKKIISCSGDNTLKVWDLQSQKLIYTFFPVLSDDYFIQLPSGYYQCSPNAAKLLHYVTKDLKVITFEQLDVKYNRPDKVLEAIGNTDTLLINSYRKAYQKRIKKLGVDTTQFADGYSVPEADFVNRDNIDYEQSKSKISLTIKANDSIYKLDRFNVWVNEVPVFGLRGIRVKRKNNFDTTITITLSQGENRIETSVTNINGTESYKMPLFVKYTTAKPQPSKQYFIGIGINQFANSDYNLNWSVKDIRDLAIKFKSKYPNIMIDTLFDKNVTKENILALKKKLLQLSEDDKVIVSYSGHGVLSKDFDYFLSTYSIDFTKPEENGLAYDDLESLLDNIKPRQKLLLIDACHSGEVDKDELLKIETAKTELNKNGVATKSTIKVVKKEKQLGLANSFELMQNLFVNVGKGTGATIISAAGGTQYAQERGDLKNGVFTYSIIEAMNSNTTLTVSQLKKIVGERVTQLTNGLQKPTSRNETNNYDWLVW